MSMDYRDYILDHYRNPRNRGELTSPPALRVEGFNPLCGDEVVVYLDVDGDRIDDVRINVQGCSISQSSASMMSSAVKGKSVDEARKLKIPVIGVVDTNCDPDEVDFVVPGNDDALRAIRLFASRIADAVIAGRGIRESADAETARASSDEGSADEGHRQARPARRAREAAPASA